jgi:hypothetical protein
MNVEKTVKATRMKFVAYERGNGRILFRDLEVSAPAAVWRLNHGNENAAPQYRVPSLGWRYNS